MSELKKSYTQIIEPARRQLGISRDEYALCSYLQYRAADPRQAKPGWCCDEKLEIAEFIGVTRAGLYKMAERLIFEGLIDISGGVPFAWRVTPKWIDTESQCKQSLHDGVNKVDTRRKQSLHDGVNKVDTHNKVEFDISKNEFEVKKEKGAAEPLFPSTSETLEAEKEKKGLQGGAALTPPLSPPFKKIDEIFVESFDHETPGCVIVEMITVEAEKEVSPSNAPAAKKPTSKTQQEIEVSERVLSYLNEKAGRSFRLNTGENAKGIISQFRQGFTESQMQKVIDLKIRQWGNDANMRGNINPVTLFRSSNFERYLIEAELPPIPKTQTNGKSGSHITHAGSDLSKYEQKQIF